MQHSGSKEDESSSHTNKLNKVNQQQLNANSNLIKQSNKGQKNIALSGNGNGNGTKRNHQSNKNHSHPWLVTTFKGHTSEVRDMDFSSNGKYLASCAEGKSCAYYKNIMKN